MRSCGLEELVCHFARYLNEEVKEKKGDVWVEGTGRTGGGADEGEEIVEEGWVLRGVCAHEEEG